MLRMKKVVGIALIPVILLLLSVMVVGQLPVPTPPPVTWDPGQIIVTIPGGGGGPGRPPRTLSG